MPWARLTMPPMPVTTTNDRKISESVSPPRDDADPEVVGEEQDVDDQEGDRDRPGQRPAPQRQVGQVVGRRRLVGRRTTPAASFAGHDHETDEQEDERAPSC